MNLCTNAAQAIENNGTICVTLEEVFLNEAETRNHVGLTEGWHVKLTVADTGRGLTDDVARRMFDPFFTTKEKGEGTGMSLSVVHGIVKKHGGAILFESEPNRGSRFEIYLPTIEDKAQEEALVKRDAPRGTERILFVDDEPFLVELETKLLESLGYRVVSAESSYRALSLFRESPWDFDVVVTDLTMPKMNGRELARSMHEIRPDRPVVLCTGFSGTYDEAAAKREGICALVHKPIIKSDIAKAVRSAIDGPTG
jgi:CheY-like chemotaxis protein